MKYFCITKRLSFSKENKTETLGKIILELRIGVQYGVKI